MSGWLKDRAVRGHLLVLAGAVEVPKGKVGVKERRGSNTYSLDGQESWTWTKNNRRGEQTCVINSPVPAFATAPVNFLTKLEILCYSSDILQRQRDE